MNAREKRAFVRLDSAAVNLDRDTRSPVHVYLKNVPPMYERFVAKLQASVARLHELELEQDQLTPQRAREGRETASVRKRLRRQYMIPLTRIGRPLLRFAGGIEQALKVPHARASHRELVTAAEVMLKAVAPHRALLVSEGFPKTFFTEFRGLTKELKRIATTSSARQEKFASVSEKLRAELASAKETLRIIDGLVLAHADRDKRFAKVWKDALRTPKPLGRPRAKKGKLSPNESRNPRETPLTA
jgi:hypothetical protein